MEIKRAMLELKFPLGEQRTTIAENQITDIGGKLENSHRTSSHTIL